jgi:hypothetical protein
VVVQVLVMAAQMDLAHQVQREGIQIGDGITSLIGARDTDVVHIKQQPAAGAPRKLGQELDFADRRLGKCQLGRGILHQHPATALAQMVLGMDLRPADRAGVGQDRAKVLRLVADARSCGQSRSDVQHLASPRVWCPGPAAQSFWPASAPPKHFSFAA